MLQAGPEIHSERTHLNLDLHPALALEQDQGHLYNDMQTLIAVRLRMSNIVLYFYDAYILTGLQMIQQTIDILDKSTYDTHTRYVVNLG
ncbi:hypothetical protein D3C71_1988830 [compost metagenome]